MAGRERGQPAKRLRGHARGTAEQRETVESGESALATGLLSLWAHGNIAATTMCWLAHLVKALDRVALPLETGCKLQDPRNRVALTLETRCKLQDPGNRVALTLETGCKLQDPRNRAL